MIKTTFKLVLPILAILGLSACSSDDSANIIYYEGFEDGNVGQWAANPNASDNTAISIDSTIGANGTSSSLYLDNTQGSGDYWNGAAYITFPDGITPSYISYYVRYKENADTTGAPYAIAVIGHDNVDTRDSTPATYTEVVTDGVDLDYMSINDITVGEPLTTVNTWHHVEYRNMVFSDGTNTGTVDIFIDGVELETGVVMNNGSLTSGLSIKAISVGNDADPADGGAQEAWFDELLIM